MPYRPIRRKASGSKATAWTWFAKYIKLRDALDTTGDPQWARCITCNEEFNIDDMDAGHMIPGRTGGILLDESIVFAQCRHCNREGNGERQAFKAVMVARNGIEWYEVKEQARKTATKLGDFECKLISDEYREKYKALVKRENTYEKGSRYGIQQLGRSSESVEGEPGGIVYYQEANPEGCAVRGHRDRPKDTGALRLRIIRRDCDIGSLRKANSPRRGRDKGMEGGVSLPIVPTLRGR